MRTPQAHFTSRHQSIHQRDSETQRIPNARLVAFGEKSVGFLYVYAGILGSMYFEIPTFDFQHPSTQPTEPGSPVRLQTAPTGPGAN